MEIHKGMGETNKHLADIKADLAFHISRTNQLEDRAEITERELKALNRQVALVHGAIALIALVGSVVSIYKSLKG